MEINYYNDAARNYMVLECPSGIRDNYQYKMLVANQIKGLLVCSSRTIDSREYLYYDITSRQSLTDLYERRGVRGDDLRDLLESLVRVEETLAEYLLDSAHLLLEPSCVYIDFREQSYSFTYYPGEEQERGWETLFTFLADRLEGKDKQAAALIYRLCMMAERPGFRLRREMLEEPGMNRNSRREKNPFPEDYSDIMGGSRSFGGETGAMHDPEVPFGYYGKAEAVVIPGSVCSSYGQKEPVSRWSGYEPGPDLAGTAGWHSAGRTEPEDPSRGIPVNERGCARKAGNKRWMVFAGFPLIPAGLLLFFLSRWVYMEERELLLSHAFGGLLIVAGTVLTLAWFVLYKRKKRVDRGYPEKKKSSGSPGPDTGEDRSTWEPAPWEQGWLPETSSSMYSDQPVQLSLHSGQTQKPPAYAEETSLLSKNQGTAAGLYGTGNYRGEQVSLTNLPCVVGKMQEYVDQVLNDTTVSRMHARFWRDAEGCINVRDLNSTNGTWVNGERLQPNEGRTIEPGDHIRLGRMEFVYR